MSAVEDAVQWLLEYTEISAATSALYGEDGEDDAYEANGEARIDQAFAMEEHAAGAVPIISSLVALLGETSAS